MGPETTSSAFYTCTFPGCPNPVRVSVPLIASLHELVLQSEDDRQGILQGSITPGLTEVRSCRPVARLAPDAMGRAVTGDREAVGYYRIRTTDVLELNPEEMAIAEEYFGRPGAVVLLIKRGADPEANFFFRENGAFLNFRLLSFPLDAGKLGHRLVAADRKALPPSPANREGPLAVADEPAARKRRFPLGTIAGVLLAAAGGFLAVTLGLPHREAKKAAVSAAAPAPPPAPSATVPLRAERQGSDLRIVWDLDSSAVTNAVSGVLKIDDGGVTRTIPLDARQVRFGSVLYTPRSDEVSVDLTALKEDGTAGQASVLVLLGKSPDRQTAGSFRNFAAPGDADRRGLRVDSTARPEPVRTFVPPPEKKNEAKPTAEVDAMPVARLAPQRVENLTLPPAVPPPAPKPAPALAAAPPVTSAPVQAVTPPQTRAAQPAAYTPPELIFQAGARLPTELRAFQNRPVLVPVHVNVDATGRVVHTDVQPQKTLHVAYVTSAVEAAMLCRFKPARRGNTPVPGEAVITFRFAFDTPQ
jgi:hypothetical protein